MKSLNVPVNNHRGFDHIVFGHKSGLLWDKNMKARGF
jgi:hypothetical protein